MSLDDVVTYIAKIVADRAAQGNNFGTVLIPEGLVEFIPAMKRLIAELNDFLAANAEEFSQIKKSHQRDYIIRKLSPENAASLVATISDNSFSVSIKDTCTFPCGSRSSVS